MPATWQGWAVTAVWMLIVVGGSTAIARVPEAQQGTERALFLTFMTIATIGLFRISYAKGPKPRWRWGPKPGDDPDEDF